MDWHRVRDVVEVDYRWAEGIPLESLTGCVGWICKALIHRKWRCMYFLMPRYQWTDQEYFDFAEKRMKEIGIKEP